MSVTKVFLSCAFSAFCVSCYSQTYVGVHFDNLAAPAGCIRPNPVPPATTAAIPALKLPGVTIAGGQVLSYNNPYQIIFNPSNNVYYTYNGCAGVQPSITITFDGPVSALSIGALGQFWTDSETVQAQDDRGGSQTYTLLSSNTAGQTIYFTNSNIRKVTLTLLSPAWTQSAPAGFYIDNLSFYLNQPVNFVDPVPELMNGTGVVSDPESLANMGHLVKGVSADGVARLLLTVQASHVGEMVTFTVLDENGGHANSQEDGAVSTVSGGSNSRSQSVKVAAQDSSVGPMAFALYYPPADFSRGQQDDQRASRTVGIRVDSSAPNTPAATRSLLLVRPPVLLVHDLWGDPTDWDNFLPLLGDARFSISRASYNAVLGNRITASLPVVHGAALSHARESSLGLAYNAPLLLTQITQTVNEFRATQNVAAAQADVIVHGMGGDIARALVQLANYAGPESFGQGNINKLITIGTPHLGTPLAAALLRNENACPREILAAAGSFSFSSTTVDGATVAGGIGDLQGNGFGGSLSPALARIQQNGNAAASTAVIAGVADRSNMSGLDRAHGISQFIRAACPASPLASKLTSTGWSDIAGDFNDGMTPLYSQLAGMFGSPLLGLVHSAGFEQLGLNAPAELEARTPAGNAVISLLNTQVRSWIYQQLP